MYLGKAFSLRHMKQFFIRPLSTRAAAPANPNPALLQLPPAGPLIVGTIAGPRSERWPEKIYEPPAGGSPPGDQRALAGGLLGAQSSAGDAKTRLQGDARDKLLAAFVDDGLPRATVVFPGGAGKTVLALRTAEALLAAERSGKEDGGGGGAFTCLVLAPALELISQTHREWKRWREPGQGLDNWETLAVCSSVSEPGLDRTTTPSDIAQFFTRGGARPRVLFCTYHSNAKVAEALRSCGRTLDMMVLDEAHTTTGRASKRSAQPLLDAELPARRRLFMTATPRLFASGKEAARDAEGDVVAVGFMDDERLYGPTVYRLGHTEAVSRGVVAPLKLVFLNVSESYERMIARHPELRVIVNGKSLARERNEKDK